MAFNDYTQYPRGRRVIADIGSTAKLCFAVTNKVKITHVVISGGAAEREVTFRAIDDSPKVVIVSVPTGVTYVIPGWQVDGEGLEVVTDSATTDVNVTLFTVEDTISNLA